MSNGLARIEVEGFTRASFILRGALAAGAAYGVGAVGPFVARSFAQLPASDMEVLQFALGLEQLEAGFYKAALAQAGLTGQVKNIATEFGTHEATHAKTINDLIVSLGGKPNPAAKAKFDVKDRKSFLETAIALEETGIGAYNGAAAQIETPEVLDAAGGIVHTEARHAGALRMLAGQDPAPQAYDTALPAAEVAKRVKPFLQTG
jgi:rubrerythrin